MILASVMSLKLCRSRCTTFTVLFSTAPCLNSLAVVRNMVQSHPSCPLESWIFVSTSLARSTFHQKRARWLSRRSHTQAPSIPLQLHSYLQWLNWLSRGLFAQIVGPFLTCQRAIDWSVTHAISHADIKVPYTRMVMAVCVGPSVLI